MQRDLVRRLQEIVGGVKEGEAERRARAIVRVPFQPRGDKPVYCSDCFEQRRPSQSRSRY